MNHLSLAVTDLEYLIGGVVQENPFYTPPGKMLKELRARTANAEELT